MFNTKIISIIFFIWLTIIINEVNASEATNGVSKDEFKRTVGMTKQEVKNKFGPPDNTADGVIGKMWVYFDLYDPETEKSNHYNDCSLFFGPNDTVDHVTC
ncbi:hypothetical protein [Methylosarcina fibrata]|uniref:hypothetical protein n=1 Tax=Methylosarcina fibrata TaxID=105972 RepID=UPI000366877F|nr:hypothetical protein [Methylosarcina fibrata]